MESTMKQMKENNAEAADKIVDKVKSVSTSAAERAQELTSSATFGARTLVKAYPFASVGAALSLGLLFGLALGRAVR